MSEYGFGWVPDLPDHRDLRYAAPMHIVSALPDKVDLRDACPPVYDQGKLGSCTANAIGAALQFARLKQGRPAYVPSRLFVYYCEREMEGTIDSDAGAQIRDGIKCVAKFGAPIEDLWPYDITKFTERPPEVAYFDGGLNQALKYERLNGDELGLKSCLATGFPVVFGFSVYESFESDQVAQTGDAPMPGANERLLGGHAVLLVGYDDSRERWIVRNSWSQSWGDRGYFTMPYDYLTDPNLSDDFWTVRLVE